MKIYKVILFACLTGSMISRAATLQSNSERSAIGLEYRTEITAHAREIDKSFGDNTGRTVQIKMNDLNLNLLTHQQATAFKAQFNLLNLASKKSIIQIAKATYTPSNWASFFIGIDHPNIAGFSVKNYDYSTIISSSYVELSDELLPFALYTPQLGAVFNLNYNTQITAQFLNDVDREVAFYRQEKLQPAFAVEYLGIFGPIRTIAQVGTYDLNHSKFYSLSIGMNTEQLKFYFDYHIDLRANHDQSDSEYIDRLRMAGFNAAYTWPKVLTYCFSIYDYRRRQFPNDINANEYIDEASNATSYNYNEIPKMLDNNLSWGTSLFGEFISPMWRPYIAYHATGGRFKRISDDTPHVFSKSDLIFKLGMLGEF